MEEQFDIRDYAETRGISLAQARVELDLEPEEEEATSSQWTPAQLAQMAAENAPPAEFNKMPPMAGYGHNSGAQVTAPDASTLTLAARDKLKQIVARVNKLDEEKKEVANQIKDVYAEAKSMGYDTKALRIVIREMNMDRQELEERDMILDVYREALGFAD